MRTIVIGGTRFIGRAVVDEHADPETCVRDSVRWHLGRPPSSGGDFIADDRALA